MPWCKVWPIYDCLHYIKQHLQNSPQLHIYYVVTQDHSVYVATLQWIASSMSTEKTTGQCVINSTFLNG